MIDLHPPTGDDSNLKLAEIVAREIQNSGPITFARFMDLVIGHHEHGYYASSTERVGRGGDFLTAPATHPIFGWLVARQVLDCWTHLGGGPNLTIREYGAGDATLARQILEWFANRKPEGLRSVSYEVEDLNPAHARTGFAPDSADGSASISLVPSSDESITGVILANELLDALPFHRLVIQDGQAHEIFVIVKDGWFAEQVGPLTEDAVEALSDPVPAADGQQFEVSPAVKGWVRGVAECLDCGYVIIFDYGNETDRLRDPDRFPEGTIKTYRQHQVGTDPYRNIGNQDITAHVDFDLVTAAARESGLHVEGITSQAEFVAGLGLDEILMEIQRNPETESAYPEARAAAMELLDPGGLGRFRVAILSKNVETNDVLRGLAFRLPGLVR